MKGVSNEATNTDKMRQHQLTKTRVQGDGMRHEEMDLMVCTDLIDQSQTTALNSDSAHATILEVLKANPEDKALASDVDHQLLMKVCFKEKVNLSAISLRFNSPPPNNEEENEIYAKPRLIKVFTNMDDLDFCDVESAEARAQVVLEGGEDETEVKISCLGHKFQRLGSVQILVEEVADTDATRTFVNRLSIMGHQAQSYHAEYK